MGMAGNRVFGMKVANRPAATMRRTFLIILATAVLLGCECEHDGKRRVLDWTDAEKKVAFWVTENPTMVKTNSELHVGRDGGERAILIDDDAAFSTVAFVRHDRWLLVVCRGLDEVWAGYDYDTGRMYGEYDWEKLPFTRWSGQGKVVAEKKLRDQGYSPVNFPRPSAGRG
jgi:hypothetical protein